MGALPRSKTITSPPLSLESRLAGGAELAAGHRPRPTRRVLGGTAVPPGLFLPSGHLPPQLRTQGALAARMPSSSCTCGLVRVMDFSIVGFLSIPTAERHTQLPLAGSFSKSPPQLGRGWCQSPEQGTQPRRHVGDRDPVTSATTCYPPRSELEGNRSPSQDPGAGSESSMAVLPAGLGHLLTAGWILGKVFRSGRL